MNSLNRHQRLRSRFLTTTALALTVTLGAAGCSTDTLAQSSKAVGDDPAIESIDVPAEDQLIETSEIPPAPAPEDIEALSTATAGTEPDSDAESSGPEVPEGADQAPETAAPEDPAEQQDQQLKGDHLGPRAHMSIATLPGLKKIGDESTAGGCRGYRAEASEIPGTIPASSTADWCRQADVLGTAKIQANYRLDGTNDLLWTYTEIPTVGDNIVKCSVLDARTWKTQLRSRYSCKAEFTADGGHGLNPKPRVHLYEKPTEVITDDAEAQRLLKEHCSSGEPECRFISTKQEVKAQENSKWHVLHVYRNCGSTRDENARHLWSDKVKHELEAKVGGSLTFKFGDMEKIGAAIEGRFERVWSTEREYTAGVDEPVVWGWASILYAQESNVHVTGDFEIAQPDRLVRIIDNSFMFPLKASWKDETGMNYIPELLHAGAVPVKCPNEGVVTGTADENTSEDRLKGIEPMPDEPTAEWVLANGGTITELD
ncbi:MAG: hypothetical protein ACK5LO_02775 [Leucobacter sp.]